MVVTLLLMSVGAIGMGGYFCLRGLHGIKEKQFPLTDDRDLEGLPAQIAAAVMVSLGVLAILSGLAIASFAIWRATSVSA